MPMGFAEDVKAKISESLNERIRVAEEAVKNTDSAQTQYVADAAATKLDLMILRKRPTGPKNADRAAKEASMQARLRHWRDQYAKAEQDLCTYRKDLAMYHGIRIDVRKGALRLIA